MNLHEFKETLLEFLGDVTTIPEKAKANFLTSEDGAWRPNLAPDGFKVLTDYLLFSEEFNTRKVQRPTPENGQIDKPETEIFHYRVCFRIYTATHRYSISAVWHESNPQYLGCCANVRIMRAGEDWIRGNDLPDGYFCRETWECIKNRILHYEMVALSDFISNGHYIPPNATFTKVDDKTLVLNESKK